MECHGCVVHTITYLDNYSSHPVNIQFFAHFSEPILHFPTPMSASHAKVCVREWERFHRILKPFARRFQVDVIQNNIKA